MQGDADLKSLEGRCKLFGGLPVEQERKLVGDPRKSHADLAGIVGRHEKEAAEQQRHRHRHRAERKPSATPAVGRDEKREKSDPGSE